MTKKTLIVANWKMHLNTAAASLLVHRLHQHLPVHRDIEVVLAPTMLCLQPISVEVDHRKFRLASQDAYPIDEGAYTGEVSFSMLRDLVSYGIVGHSERRAHFSETLEQVRDKVQAAVRNEITPILCIGETLTERQSGETHRVLHDQLTTAIANLTGSEVESMVVAYEPVWAIGTGSPAKPREISEVVQYIRHNIGQLHGAAAAEGLRVLYGGSTEPEFVSGILAIDGVDGFLVGGASLNYQKFVGIVDNAYRFQHQQPHA